jgi:hypothetical protein
MFQESVLSVQKFYFLLFEANTNCMVILVIQKCVQLLYMLYILYLFFIILFLRSLFMHSIVIYVTPLPNLLFLLLKNNLIITI